MNPVELYLGEKKTEKTAGLLSGMREGATKALTGRTPDMQRMLRGVSPADAMSAMHGVGQQVGERGIQGAAAVGGGLLAAGAGVAAQKLYDAATKARDFRSMLEANPDLAQHHEEQPRLFNQMFSTLRTFNPSFSKDPLVAGNYMRQMMEDPVHAGGKVVETLDYRDKMRSPLMSAFGGGKKSK